MKKDTGKKVGSKDPAIKVDGPDKTATTIGDRIRRAREAKNLSQSELARRLNIRPQTVGMWEDEKNYTAPKRNRMDEIAAKDSFFEKRVAHVEHRYGKT